MPDNVRWARSRRYARKREYTQHLQRRSLPQGSSDQLALYPQVQSRHRTIIVSL
jgi:hypothetical protein